MRPDRLIIGEIRNSREAHHTLEGLNTGHDGSATTIHARSCGDALARLELLVGRSFNARCPVVVIGQSDAEETETGGADVVTPTGLWK